ncbi:MAG: terpene cyclase/mutase family protein [Planctomycetia bacterium]|nr:terpene cyclase/mutase family protein [Planctomycetia bacterium]
MSSDALPPIGSSYPAPSGTGESAPSTGVPLPPTAPIAPPPVLRDVTPRHPTPPPIPRASLPRALPVAEAIEEEPRWVIPRKEVRAPAKANSAPSTDAFRGSRKLIVSSLVSGVVHFALVLLLALLGFDTTRKPPRVELEGTVASVVAPSLATLPKVATKIQRNDAPATKTESPRSLVDALIATPAPGRKGSEFGNDPKLPPAGLSGNSGLGDLLTPLGGSSTTLSMLDGRDGELKGILLQDGGSEETEKAVARGLRWLAAHQREDGSWHFNHRQEGICKYCGNPGNHGSSTAATGFALLPFLGANHTHRRGEYQETVRKGLEYLKAKTIATPLGGDLQEGINLYSQAIATLALCEAYALTRDEDLHYTCREAVRFIVNSQDKKGGGWRYFPGQVGDTTVTGWMLMALKSGELTYMPVPPEVWTAAKKFLDGVQDDGGAAYGYQSPAKNDPTMTSIGLLSRMYGGWPRSQPALQRGIRSLSKRGPSDHDQYYNYYATQVFRHFGGQEWIAWNEEMKAFLLESQSREGHTSGSWYFPDKHGDQGGRLYNTAMSILILEVYYRYLPIYGHRATSEDFR